MANLSLSVLLKLLKKLKQRTPLNDTHINQVLDILEADGYQVRASDGTITPEGLSLIKIEFRVIDNPEHIFRKVDRLLNHVRLVLTEFPQSGRWLDVGCGCGGTTLRLSDACKEGSVIGLDLQEYTLSALKIIEPLYGVSLTGVLADGFDLPFQSDAFDLVFMLDVVEHVPNLLQFLTEARRVARPSGMLMVLFPPYYSAYGGHRKLPYLHYLPDRLWRIIDANQFSRREYSLYKLTIGDFESACARAGWHILFRQMVPMLNFGLCANDH